MYASLQHGIVNVKKTKVMIFSKNSNNIKRVIRVNGVKRVQL